MNTRTLLRDELARLQTEHAQWAVRNFGVTPSWQPLLGALEELGELAHAHLKGVQGIRHTPEEVRAKKVDAVGDVLIYLIDYCTKEGILIGDALADTWEEVEKRDWQKNPTGEGL